MNEFIMELVNVQDNNLVERFRLVTMKKHKPAFWKRMLVLIIFISIYVSSYSFVIQSSFDAPIDSETEDAYYFDETNSYIEYQEDGFYYVVTPYENLQLNERELNFFIENGFNVIQHLPYT